jgi:hypothetical protein
LTVRHAGEGRHPRLFVRQISMSVPFDPFAGFAALMEKKSWMPAFAGMTGLD